MVFNTLPIELNEHIASYLRADIDIANFASVCQATHNASESHRCGLWRKLYANKFNIPEGRTGIELKVKYKLRCRALRRTTYWQKGHDPNEKRVLKILRDLVLESYAYMPSGRQAKTICNNVIALREYVQKSNLLDKVLSCLHRDRTFNPALKILQLVLFHFQLDHTLGPVTEVYGFQYSQKAVYGHPQQFPLFKRNYNMVNIDLLMHIANFFKYHLVSPQAQTLYDLFRDLKPYELPKAWDSKIQQGPGVGKIGKHWKGSYAYLHDHNDMRQIRTSTVGTMGFTDSIDYQDGLQTLELDFSPAASYTPWPRAFESHLKGKPPLSLCKKLDKLLEPCQYPNVTSFIPLDPTVGHEDSLETPPCTPGPPSGQDVPSPTSGYVLPLPAPLATSRTCPIRGTHYQQFRGSGTDAESYCCNGILHPLPPQYDIPGWHRISLMKYFEPENEGASSSSSSPSSSTPTTPHNLSPTSSHSSMSSTCPTSSAQWPQPVDKQDTFTPVNTFSQNNYEVNVDNGCWAYEGVVLPGGKIILGRWWSPIQDSDEMICMGPFIFWEVDIDEP